MWPIMATQGGELGRTEVWHRKCACAYSRQEEANLVHLQGWATNQRGRTLQKFNSDLVCQQTSKICLSIRTHPQASAFIYCIDWPFRFFLMGPALPPRAGQWPRLPEYPDSGSVSRKSKQTTPPLPNESRPPESNVASATSSRSAGVSDATSFRHFMNRGRAYREQATTLIEICRLYQPPTYTESDAFQK